MVKDIFTFPVLYLVPGHGKPTRANDPVQSYLSSLCVFTVSKSLSKPSGKSEGTITKDVLGNLILFPAAVENNLVLGKTAVTHKEFML